MDCSPYICLQLMSKLKNKTILFIFISKLYNDNDKYCVKNECVYNNVK